VRYLCLLLICCLLPGNRACALDVFADFLYWKATNNVDWVLNTNRDPVDQFVTYQTFGYGFKPGLRFGVGQEEGTWNTKIYYTHYDTSTTDTASGNLTGGFMAAKLQHPLAPKLYYDTGQAFASLNYNIFDWDFGRRFNPTESLMVRPIVGVRGGWIDQRFDTAFQSDFLGLASQSLAEHIRNNFWGVGPKVGIENNLSLWRADDEREINLVANFYAAYLLGQWNISDNADITNVVVGVPIQSTMAIRTPDRDFGSLAFQAILGFNVKYCNWAATFGYELNDWLNQCQIFDDATGAHNNDLLFQGLTVNVCIGF
jgi:hypothetical protein